MRSERRQCSRRCSTLDRSTGGFFVLHSHRLVVRSRVLCFALLAALGCAGTHAGKTDEPDGGAAGTTGNAGTTGTAGVTGNAGSNNPFDDGSAGAGGDIGTGGDDGGAAGGVVVPDASQTDGPPLPTCGNSVIDQGETCDDGDSAPGDGCDGTCHKEPNYDCPEVGKPCVSTIVCGDGKVQGNEQCDDGNTNGGDGCTPACVIQSGYNCPPTGGTCTIKPPPPCGNSVKDTGEGCDDGNTMAGDGCSATCTIENGYMCPTAGAKCSLIPYCGDKLKNAAGEECDDGNTSPGDGCTGTCKIEPNFKCPTPGSPCVSTIVCGDLLVTGDEACDDGNTNPNDGCSADCKQVEGGYTCPTANGQGGACAKVAMPKCGDGALGYGEYCDDGNTNPNDGCSMTCTIETGYTCDVPGQKCMLVTFCGDGKLTVADGEQCDDMNVLGGDGCSATCIVEANWTCPTPGQPCISTVKCGDKKVTGTEQCDDGNLVNGDGCTLGCEIECGWTCSGGACRATKCGDGFVAGTEACDDGNLVNGDGCSSTCALESKAVTGAEGWTCTTPTQANGCIGPTACTTTTCGNNVREGSEQCDDANTVTGDKCSPFCRLEPVCDPSGGPCATACGDGLIVAADKTGANPQECDDGNILDGDGCSHDCKVEPGYACTDVAVRQNPLVLPIVYHDFLHYKEVGGHPDFDRFNGDGVAGIAQFNLGPLGVPVHGPTCTAGTANPSFNVTYCDPGTTTPTWDKTVDYYSAWYVDTSYSKTIVQTLTLGGQLNGANSATCSTGANPDCTSYAFTSGAFFPIDNMGWGNTPGETHNYGFTSQTRYWFQYTGTATLSFNGDDDVWVYINKRLAVDLGGLHQSSPTSITLDPTNGHGYTCDFVNPGPSAGQTLLQGCSSVNKTGGGRDVDLGLQIGSVYEIVVFQAERRRSASNYRLTLSKFSGTKSSCAPKCGDTIVSRGEACDLGTANNTGAYGGCKADCTLAPGCGDGMTNGPEQCDNGVNMTQYGGTTKQCAPGCVWAPYCGDGKIDGANGEACDDGANNGKGYGFCTSGCKLGPRCGDGAVTDAETCDDGANNGNSTSKCGATCQLKCGNGMLDVGEQCDDGKAANTGGYGKCNANCTLGARCGDGIKNGTEACDDGKNDGSYGNCAPGCVLGPRCGDSAVQTGAGEVCDKGSGNQPAATAYGKDVCTSRCLPAPYCGDKSVDSGETCDDGMNTGQPGSCSTDCKAYIPLPSCGDSKVDQGEQCDHGGTNGAAGDTCDSHCHYACGNGVKDTGEECDNGVNDGSYGTCTSMCKLAPYCGDGTKNGPEKCDNGATNSDTAYGPGTCTKMCQVGPYCGDGRIQTGNGEQCDGTQGCSNTCKVVIIQ
jgi:fibro-slime domain-containing protein